MTADDAVGADIVSELLESGDSGAVAAETGRSRQVTKTSFSSSTDLSSEEIIRSLRIQLHQSRSEAAFWKSKTAHTVPEGGEEQNWRERGMKNLRDMACPSKNGNVGLKAKNSFRCMDTREENIEYPSQSFEPGLHHRRYNGHTKLANSARQGYLERWRINPFNFYAEKEISFSISKQNKSSSDSKNNQTMPTTHDLGKDEEGVQLIKCHSSDRDEDSSVGSHNHHNEPEAELSFYQSLVDRAAWLVGLLVLQSFSSFILKSNEKLLQRHAVIVRFLTMLVGAGGNAGNQASVRYGEYLLLFCFSRRKPQSM